ncbi:unnamed protein product, partial [Arabidopsis halleri]
MSFIKTNTVTHDGFLKIAFDIQTQGIYGNECKLRIMN